MRYLREASMVSASCGIRRMERERFREIACDVARRFGLYVLIDEEDGVSTASFFREDQTEAPA
jgi:hypothetical protein